ncbi:helix-turn-helix domain-containing protein [Pseudomonas sp. P3C3]
MRSVLKKALGATLRAYRIKRQIPQEGMGPSQSYVSSLEAGRWSPSLEKIEQMASVLGVHPATIIVAGYIYAEENSNAVEILKRIESELQEIELP